MEVMLQLLSTHGAGLGILGAAIAFSWSVFQFFSVRAREARAREFETFHKLIKELVEPPAPGASLFVDRQCAILYELRFFPRYYLFTRRTLRGLKEKWSGSHFPRVIEELDFTLDFIEKQFSGISSQTARFVRLQQPLEP
jgi:hypothetical protein